MWFRLTTLFLILACNVTGERSQTRPPARSVPTVQQIAERVLPSVVLIRTEDEKGVPIAQGSGFVFTDGIVVTSLHVMERASGLKSGTPSRAVNSMPQE